MENSELMRRRVWYVGLAVAVVALYAWALRGAEFAPGKLAGAFPHAWDFLKRLAPPDWSVTGTAVTALGETIQMALLGTTIGALISLPLAVLAARNLSPRWLSVIGRGLLNLIRTVPSIVWGLFFVAAVGLGPFSGVLALSVYTVGYLGKFYYETFEAMDDSAAEALRTAGATQAQVFQYAILPQSLPLLANYTIFILEYSIRAATILGVVGAGGVGYYLYVYLRNFDYQKAATMLLLLLAVVIVMDWLSGWLRQQLLHGEAKAAPVTS
ncbi:MAG: Phosphate-import permease protein PhnE [Verrucomicrobiae bacterium]|nr:Phosphate-import permease protein PhnE [Verrucomicrobiae bacterium]